jgi:hypothetical protein
VPAVPNTISWTVNGTPVAITVDDATWLVGLLGYAAKAGAEATAAAVIIERALEGSPGEPDADLYPGEEEVIVEALQACVNVFPQSLHDLRDALIAGPPHRAVTLRFGEEEVLVALAGIEWLVGRLTDQEGAVDLVAKLNETQSRETATNEVRISPADLTALRETLTSVDEAELPDELGGLLAFLDE